MEEIAEEAKDAAQSQGVKVAKHPLSRGVPPLTFDDARGVHRLQA